MTIKLFISRNYSYWTGSDEITQNLTGSCHFLPFSSTKYLNGFNI